MRIVAFEKNKIRQGLLYFIYFIAIIAVTLLCKVFFSESYAILLFDFFENVLFALILLLVAFSFQASYIRRFVFVLFLLLFSLSLLFEVLYFYFFNGHINQSAVFIFFESNIQESKEFLNAKLDRITLLVLLIFVTIFAFLGYRVLRSKNELPFFKLSRILLPVLLIIFLLRQAALLPTNLPYILAKAPFQYIFDSKEFAKLSEPIAENVFLNATKSSNTSETHIVIIGESTNRKHFSLYEHYARNTTPLLRSIKDELMVYNDVITPHTFTIGTLTKSLTRSNFEDLYKENNGSIVQLLNKSGYGTYWFSNQKPLSVTEVRVTRIAKAADSVKFYNSRGLTEKTPFDEALLPGLLTVLKKKKKLKVIFLHLLGTHLQYDLRYPKEYSKFTEQQNGYDQYQNKIVNSYDNAILYNDFLIYKIIEIAKENKVSTVLYFSDHGEDVYDTLASYGHAVDTNDEKTSRPMYEIPFFLWKSKHMANREQEVFVPNRSYMIDDLFHSLADLYSVEAEEVDHTRSIFSSEFKERKRKVGKGIDFDLKFKK